MAAMIRPVSVIVLVISISYFFLGSCQQGSPQNIETFYPSVPPPSPIPLAAPSPPPATVLPPPSPPSLSPPPSPSTTTGSPPSKNNMIVKSVIGTAAGSIAISALLIVLVRQHSRKKLENKLAGGPTVLTRDDFTRFDKNLKGLIVDENGLDVLYWRNLQSGKARTGFRREFMQGHEEGGQDVTMAITNGSQRGNSNRIQEAPLFREKPTCNFNRDVEMSFSMGKQPFTSPRQCLTPRTTGTSTPEPEVRTALAIPVIKSQTTSPPPLMPKETIFGTVAMIHQSPKGNGGQRTTSNLGTRPSRQIFLLNPKKSQNIAIVLKSLTISRKEIIDGLCQGRGLDAQKIEKLYRIAPTKEEESKILEFSGDLTRLADAESFLYHILKAIPSAFARFSMMLSRSNYQSDVLQLKESLQKLELACKELRTRGIFMKLLEAILEAGNLMNQGTSRGNAQALNLTALRKLSEAKSTDGNTTLLDFVVEEVIRAEGKRCIINRDRGLSQSRSGNIITRTSSDSEFSKSEEREKEYMLLGLPLVGGLSSEFSNVKKAAAIDYTSFSASCEALSDRVSDIRQLVSGGCGEGELFVKEMEGFLRSAEEELMALRRQQSAVMEVVKKTTEYYQAGSAGQNAGDAFQLFVIVKDFLVMVDKACIEISRKQQQKAMTGNPSGTGSSSPESPQARPGLRFPVLRPDFFSQKSRSESSDLDTGL